MSDFSRVICTAGTAVLAFSSALCLGQEKASVAGSPSQGRIDFSAAHHFDGELHLKKLDDGIWEWRLPDAKGQSLYFDLDELGIDPSLYDELRFEIRPGGSQVSLATRISNFPAEGEVSSWYLKFGTPVDQWSEGRYDLRLDDDGPHLPLSVALPPGKKGRILSLSLGRRSMGFPGEPAWRTAQIRNLRLVRHIVSASFNPLETEIVSDGAEVAHIYRLWVENRTDRRLTARLEADSQGTLKYFKVEAPSEITLNPRERLAVPVRISMSRVRAMTLQPLYSEPVLPKVWVEGAADSDVVPLMGYRRNRMWGTVPVFNRFWWTPETFQAYLRGREAGLPWMQWKQEVLRLAEEMMERDWPMPPADILPALHGQSYRCPSGCETWLKPETPTEFHRHICPKCGKIIAGDQRMDRIGASWYLDRMFGGARNCALAYLLTGEDKYALKAAKILSDYADLAPKIKPFSMRSTSGGSSAVYNTLHSSYKLHNYLEAYYLLGPAPCVAAADRKRIERHMLTEAVSVARHSSDYNNQGIEHFRAYGSVGIITGCWPLVSQAIYGEFGWHDMVEGCFSEDGIGREGGVYHRAAFGAMNHFAEFVHNQGVNLLTARFKRVFDASLQTGMYDSAGYELGYAVYRDPAYLRVISASGRHKERSLIYGVAGIPSTGGTPARSALMESDGYIFLRRGNASDFREIRMNYISQFDRSENDRLTTFLFHNSNQVDSTVGRITYGSPRANWMSSSAAHNMIVIDGADQVPQSGILVSFDPDPDHPAAAVKSDPQAPYYPGVRQIRAIAIVDDAYIVLDLVGAESPRTIDRYQYGQGQARFSSPCEPVQSLNNLPEQGAFANLAGGPAGREALVTYGNGLKMRLVADRDFHLYKAVTVGGYQAEPIEVTFARVENSTQAAFLAAFTDLADAEPPALKILEASGGRATVEIVSGGKARLLTVDADKGIAKISDRP